MNYQSEEEYNDAMSHEAEAQMEAEALAAEGAAEEERLRIELIDEEITELEKQIDYHERKIAEYRSQINSLQNKTS